MKVKLMRANMITCAKRFGDMTDEEKEDATTRPELFKDTDIFIDLSGTSKYTYHDNNDIEIIRATW